MGLVGSTVVFRPLLSLETPPPFSSGYHVFCLDVGEWDGLRTHLSEDLDGGPPPLPIIPIVQFTLSMLIWVGKSRYTVNTSEAGR